MRILFYAKESFTKRQFLKIFRQEEKIECIEIPGLDVLVEHLRKNDIDAIFAEEHLLTYKAFTACCKLMDIREAIPIFIFNQDMTPAENQFYLAEHYAKYYKKNDAPIIEIIISAITSPTILEEEDNENLSYPFSGHEQKPPSPIHMRPAIRQLYSYLFSWKNQDVSLRMMAAYLWEDGLEPHIKTLYSYIHQIRKFLGDSTTAPSKLIRIRKGIYRLIIKPEEEEMYKIF